MATRTSKLGTALPGAGASVTVFTVPAGQTYIVKEVLAYNRDTVADNVQAYALQPSPNTVALTINNASLGSHLSDRWDGFLVLLPGDQFVVTSASGHSNFWVSGSKLPGTA
jgi:hypothetical protein